LENLENARELVNKFEKEIGEEKIRRVRMKKQKPEAEEFKKSELLEKYIVKILFE